MLLQSKKELRRRALRSVFETADMQDSGFTDKRSLLHVLEICIETGAIRWDSAVVGASVTRIRRCENSMSIS